MCEVVVRCADEDACVDVDIDGTLSDVLHAACEAFSLDPKRARLAYKGQEVCPLATPLAGWDGSCEGGLEVQRGVTEDMSKFADKIRNAYGTARRDNGYFLDVLTEATHHDGRRVSLDFSFTCLTFADLLPGFLASNCPNHIHVNAKAAMTGPEEEGSSIGSLLSSTRCPPRLSLVLEGCRLSMGPIAQSLQDCECAELSLQLKQSELKAADVRLFANAVALTKVADLSLSVSDNDLGNLCVFPFAEAISQGAIPSKFALDLSRNEVSRGAGALAQAVTKQPVRTSSLELNLNANELAGDAFLSELRSASCGELTLSLRSTGLDAASMYILCRFLCSSGCPNRVTLDLNCNHIGDRGAIVFATELGQMRPTYLSVNLSNNGLGDQGVSALFSATCELAMRTVSPDVTFDVRFGNPISQSLREQIRLSPLCSLRV